MRKLRNFEYLRPTTIREATEALHHYGERAALLAGGTDLLVAMKRRVRTPAAVIDIKGIADLDTICWQPNGGLRIGARCTVAAVARNLDVRTHVPILAQGAFAIGHPQVRSRATVVGNLCNASPSADMAPPLLGVGAVIRIAAHNRERALPLEQFFTRPFRTVLAPDEIVTAVEVPPAPPDAAGQYVWTPKITSVDETLVGAAAFVRVTPNGAIGHVRLALGSVAPTPIRVPGAEAFLAGQHIEEGLFKEAGRLAAIDIAPHSRVEHRRHLTALLVERALRQAAALAA